MFALLKKNPDNTIYYFNNPFIYILMISINRKAHKHNHDMRNSILFQY